MPETTLLTLSNSFGFELSPWAARGIKMTLEPISQAGNLQRDINGNMVDLSAPQFRKYKGTISCDDQESPGFAALSTDSDGIWPGTRFTMTCLPQLGAADPIMLDIVVMNWQENVDEYGAANSWQLEWEQD